VSPPSEAATTVHLLGNPAARAGRGDGATARVAAALRAHGADVVELVADERHDVRRVLEDALATGASRLVVAGGDGLAHQAAQLLACQGVTLGLVPVGTGNDLARVLGLPLGDLDAAVVRALQPPVAVDAVRTDHGWVASVATIGFSGDVNESANRLRRPRGGARYSVATLLALPRLRPRRVRLDVDGECLETDVTLLAVANTRHFGGGMAICPQADPTDGRLDVALVGAVGRLTLLRFFPQVFAGRHVSHPAVTMLRGARVRVESSTDERLWGDGEPVGPLPVTLEAVRGALLVAGARPGSGGAPVS
jgi:diacylglycerol kinase (ATP)